MKKLFTLLLTIAMLMTMAAPAFAAVTDTFVDEIVDGFNFNETDGPVIFFTTEGSVEQGAPGHRMAFEENGDLETTLLLKQDNDRNPNHTEYIVYKMAKNICGFELDAVSCAGLGDILEDLSVFISKTGAEGSWVEVKTQATMYEYDEDIYLEWDMAYWFNTTVHNAQKIPVGYKYLKIQFNACNGPQDVPWNVAIDTVKIRMGTNDPVPVIPADKLLTKTWDQINEERDATKTTVGQGGGTTAAQGGNNTPTQGNTPTQNGDTPAPSQNVNVGDNASGSTSVIVNADGQTVPVAIVTDENGATVTVALPTDENGEVITTTAATDENGEIITTNANDDGNTVGAIGDDNQDNGNNAKKGGAVLWIVLGLVVLAAGGAAVYFFVLKKKDVE